MLLLIIPFVQERISSLYIPLIFRLTDLKGNDLKTLTTYPIVRLIVSKSRKDRKNLSTKIRVCVLAAAPQTPC